MLQTSISRNIWSWCSNDDTKVHSSQLWSSDNMEKLIDCLEDTDWPIIFSDPDINDQASIFTDYPNLCIEQCILSVKVRNRCDKLGMNGNIRRLIALSCQALNVNYKALVRHLQSVIQQEMRFAKSCHAKSLEKSFNDKPAEAWKSLKSVLMPNSNNAGCQFDNRFDKPSDCCTVVLPDILWYLWFLFHRWCIFSA